MFPDAQPPKASPVKERVSDTAMPHSPTSPTSDRDVMSPVSHDASVYPPLLQATLSVPSRSHSTVSSHSTDNSHSTDSSNSFYSAVNSLSLSEPDEALLKGAENQLQNQLENMQKVRLRMSRKDLTIFRLEQELKDTKAEQHKAEQRVQDLQEKVAEQEQELRVQQAAAGSPAQIASLQKDLDTTRKDLDTTNRYLAHIYKEYMQKVSEVKEVTVENQLLKAKVRLMEEQTKQSSAEHRRHCSI